MKNLVIPVSDIILMRNDGMIYLMRRFNTGYADGMYALPAGHIEKGETPLEAILRETTEETGVMLSAEHTEFVHIIHRSIGAQPNDEREYIDFIFTSSVWDGTPHIVETHKCDHSMWCRMDELPANTVPYVRTVIECVAAKKAYTAINEPDLKNSVTH